MAVYVSRLTVYPVKSMGGIDLEEAVLTDTGFQHDREWLVVDESRRFVTQRQHPEMALIRAEGDRDKLVLTVPGSPPMTVPRVREADFLEVTVWNDQVSACDQGDEVADALSGFLGRRVRLVAMTPSGPRQLGSSYPSPPGIHVSFADSSPLHVVGRQSLEDLNRRLDKPVRIDRFRANIVVDGSAAYAEDEWSVIRVGDVMLHVVKDCIRCQVINVDQQTGEKGIDPLETLSGYRSGAVGPRFGRKVVHESLGTIHVGDTVEVLETAS